MRPFGVTALLMSLPAWLVCACTVAFDESLLSRDGGGPCATVSCEGERLVGCGRLIEQCLLGCASAPQPHCRRPVPSNGIVAPGHAQNADLVVKSNAVLDACTGELDGAVPAGASFTTRDQAGGPRIGVMRLRSLTVQAGARLRVQGGCAVAFVTDRDIELGGILDVSAGGNTVYGAGPGGGQGAFTGPAAGCGMGVSQAQGGGGGGGGFGAAGGEGGRCGDGANGGSPCGGEALVPLLGGSGGGRGGCKVAPCDSGHGGGGGGAVALVAGARVRVLAGGGVNAGGAGGGGGLDGKTSGGGAGSGGGILIEAAAIELAEGGWLAAAGGGGGGVSATDAAAADGDPGGLGAGAAAGGRGVARGGEGSSLAGGAGQPGQQTKACGGGGGGWGRIRLNSLSGQDAAPSVHGALSRGQITVE